MCIYTLSTHTLVSCTCYHKKIIIILNVLDLRVPTSVIKIRIVKFYLNDFFFNKTVGH